MIDALKKRLELSLADRCYSLLPFHMAHQKCRPYTLYRTNLMRMNPIVHYKHTLHKASPNESLFNVSYDEFHERNSKYIYGVS